MANRLWQTGLYDKLTLANWHKANRHHINVDGTNFTKIEQQSYIPSLLKIDRFPTFFYSKAPCPFPFDKNTCQANMCKDISIKDICRSISKPEPLSYNTESIKEQPF